MGQGFRSLTNAPSEILRFGHYEAAAYPAESDRLIISCAGIRGLNLGQGRFEWGRTLRALPEDANILFVGNPARTWYATPEGRIDLVEYIRRFRDARGVTSVTTMGLSMGATGALILGGRLQADRVLAINPRLRIGAVVAPWDGRNRNHMDAMGQPDVVEVVHHLSTATRHRFVCSLDGLEDMSHLAALFDWLDENPDRRADFDILGYRGDHNLGLALHRRREDMTDVMRRLLDEKPGALPAIFTSVEASMCRLAREHLTHGDAAQTQAVLQARDPTLSAPIPLPLMRLLEDDGPPLVHALQDIPAGQLGRVTAKGWRATTEGQALDAAEGELHLQPFDFETFDRVECTLRFIGAIEGFHLDIAIGDGPAEPLAPVKSDDDEWTASFTWPSMTDRVRLAHASSPITLTQLCFTGR